VSSSSCGSNGGSPGGEGGGGAGGRGGGIGSHGPSLSSVSSNLSSQSSMEGGGLGQAIIEEEDTMDYVFRIIPTFCADSLGGDTFQTFIFHDDYSTYILRLLYQI